MNEISMFDQDETLDKKREIEELANEVYDSLVVKSEKPTMKESIFAGYFLPRILGEVKDATNVWISEWIGVTRSMAAYVKVIDDRTGELLFVAPPILQTGKLGTREGQGTLQDIVKEFMMRTKNPVTNPDRYIKTKLNETYQDLMKDVDLTDDIMQWREILIRYDRIEGEKSEEVKEFGTESDDIEDLIIY